MRIFIYYFFALFVATTHLNAFEGGTPPKQRYVLLPIGYYTPETSTALGGLFIYNIEKQGEGNVSNILSMLSYTMKQQSIFILSPHIYLQGGKVEVIGNFRYLFFPSEYYGRGNETKENDKELFTQNIITFDLGVKHRVYENYFFQPQASYQDQKVVSYKQGGLVQSEFSNGYAEYVQRSIGLAIGYDSRDYKNGPLSGAYYFATVTRRWFENPNGVFEDSSFKEYELDLRHYFKVGEKQVFVVNYLLNKEEGRSIPFQYLNKLGGGSALRGYLSGRYRDKAMSILQADYHRDFSEKFAYSVFAGVGVVAPDTDTLKENRRRHTVGAGLHYILDSESRQKMRFDVGIGEGEHGVYVVFGEAF